MAQPDWFVSKTGLNTTGDTEATAFRTIAQGINALSSSETLQISGGTYSEYNNGPNIPNGAPGNYTTIKAKPGDTVTIFIPGSGVPDPSVRRGFYLARKSYIEIDGIKINGNNRAAWDGIKCDGDPGTHHIILRNMETYQVWGQGLLTGSQNVAAKCTNIDVYDCVFHDNGNPVSGQNHGLYFGTYSSDCSAQRCDSYNNDGYGFQTWTSNAATSDNIQFIKCRAWDNTSGGFTINAVNSGVTNCIAWNNGQMGIRFNGGYGNKIYHNTTYSNASWGFWTNGGAHDVRNNIFASETTPIFDGGGGVTESNNFTADPSFVNAAADNFLLQSGSGARNYGMNLLADVPTDFDGDPRDSAPDAGAYEYK